ncbi:SRPBCC domain-containing protein [Antrihabitans sp. NCIMB 15449]|uniref:SRPBCC domain-containing protein n=1 Tax=Antrihabitans spumae TaxID=3373370 RepID=A0ABW7JJ53_9NOCA
MTSTETAAQPAHSQAAPAPSLQVYRVYIKVTPQKVWDAITSSEWTTKYGYGGLVDYSSGQGEYKIRPDEGMVEGAKQMGFPLPDVVVDGEILEYDPPRKLALTWRMAMDPDCAAEGFTKLTYEIDAIGDGSRLTLTHELENAPKHAAMVVGADAAEAVGQGGGGWPWVLSDLKSLLETGETFSPRG